MHQMPLLCYFLVYFNHLASTFNKIYYLLYFVCSNKNSTRMISKNNYFNTNW